MQRQYSNPGKQEQLSKLMKRQWEQREVEGCDSEWIRKKKKYRARARDKCKDASGRWRGPGIYVAAGNFGFVIRLRHGFSPWV